MNTICRSALVALAVISTASAMGQPLGQWNVYPSYWQATANQAVGNTVYALQGNNLMTYNIDDTQVRTLDCINHLNGVHIAHMAYNADTHTIILVYTDGGIDLMDTEGRVSHLSGLKDKAGMAHAVAAVCCYGHMAYLCTATGYIELDLDEQVLRHTYTLGLDVKALAEHQGSIYLATQTGLYSCQPGANRFLRDSWKQLSPDRLSQLISFSDKLWAMYAKHVYTIDPATGKKWLFQQGPFNFLRLATDRLIFADATRVAICTGPDAAHLTIVDHPNTWLDASFDGHTYWASQAENGLMGYRLNEGQLLPQAGPIQPNSPMRDLCYRMQWVGNRLLVAGGINTVDAIYHHPTAMYLEEGEWTNLPQLPQDELLQAYPRLRLANVTSVVQDPKDPTHHFAALHRNGLAEYRDGKFVMLYNPDNSPIASILPAEAAWYNYVSCSGLQYDVEGRLWMLNSETKNIIRLLHPDGKWTELYYPEIEGASLCDDYLFHSSGLRFLTSRRTDKRGIFAFDVAGTLQSQIDDRHLLRQVVVNQDETAYHPNQFFSLTEDLDGRIWCGTDQGLFVINNAEDFFADDFRFEQVKIPRNDGTGLADYLLNGVAISCVAVDGGNRKWVGTFSDGVYLLSADGTEMIHHFTTAQSPLISDVVQCIAVNPTNGLVMIGTEMGLCSFAAEATQPVDDMTAGSGPVVYPNPAGPDYNGPIAVRGLEIDSEVKILSSTGQLVWSGTSAGGTFTWNGHTQGGRPAASGVYHVVANDAQGKRAVVARLVIIR